MTLAGLRKLSIKKRYQIHFRLRNGMECVISEHGVAHVPELRALPDFNLEEELGAATEFLLEPAPAPNAKTAAKAVERPRKVSRQELAVMIAPAAGAAAHADHDED
jgi:hypothetical protein